MAGAIAALILFGLTTNTAIQEMAAYSIGHIESWTNPLPLIHDCKMCQAGKPDRRFYAD